MSWHVVSFDKLSTSYVLPKAAFVAKMNRVIGGQKAGQEIGVLGEKGIR